MEKRWSFKLISSMLCAIMLLNFVVPMGGNVLLAVSQDESQKVANLESTKNVTLNKQVQEPTELYKEWLNLSEEEKKFVLEPSMYGTDYEPMLGEQANVEDNLSVGETSVDENAQASKFDLREHITIAVKNQMETQSCWAFPIVSEVETNISLTRGYDSPIFSARHMEYATAKTFLDGTNNKGYNREVGSGGNSLVGLSYYTSGIGPVLEKDMPFENNENQVNLSEIDKPAVQKIESYTRFPNIIKEVQDGVTINKDNKGNILTDEQVNEIRQQIKNHIVNYGGVSANSNSSQTQYFNNATPIQATAYYCNNSAINPDHLVTIIGWDDNYSKENFNSDCRPSKDGAWLVLNSYGRGFNEGYYYISYEDVMVEQENSGVISVVDKDYKHLYQYDILAPSLFLTTEANTAYEANVFTRKETERLETLKEIAITGSSSTQTADVYINLNGELDISNSTLVASNVIIPSGYTTVKLQNPVNLSNPKFAVIVKVKNEQGVVIPIEAKVTESGVEAQEGASKWDTATANAGEGFISHTGESGQWEDVTTDYPTGSLCIKAFTTTDEDTQGPTVTFEPNGDTTYRRSQSTKITMTDPSGVNESTIRYVWRHEPNNAIPASEFKDLVVNGATVTNNTETGDDWVVYVMGKDMLGNPITAGGKSGRFYLDNTPPTMPTITANGNNHETITENAVIHFSGSTALSGIKKYQYTLDNGNTWHDANSEDSVTFENNGTYTIKARAISETDIEGIVSEAEYVITVSKAVTDTKPTNPTISAQTTDNTNVQSNTWVNKDVNVTISGSTYQGGIKAYKYSMDNSSDTSNWTEVAENEAIPFTSDGTYQIYAIAIGNDGEESDITGPYIIKVDKTSPNITNIEENGIYHNIVPNIEDISTIKITLIKDGEVIPYEEGDQITEEGDYTLTVEDEAKNETVVHFKIEKSAPIITFTPNGNNVYGKSQSTIVTITGQSEIDPSSVRYKWTQSVQVLTEETFMPDSQAFTSGDTITKNTDSGEWYLWVLAKDKAGNMSLVKSQKFNLDNEIPTAPQINSTVENNGLSIEDVEITISGSDSPSGIAKYQYTLNDGETWIDVAKGERLLIQNEGVYTIKARAINNVNTIGRESEEYKITVSKEGLSVTFTPNGNSKYQLKQLTKIEANTKGEITTLKYLWSKKEDGIKEEDFEQNLENKQTIEKDSDSGKWYVWVLAKDTKENIVIQRSKEFLLDNDMPIIEGITSGKVFTEPVVPTIKDATSEVTVTVTKDGETYSYKKGDTLKENGKYIIKAVDEAGNTTQVQFEVKNKQQQGGDKEPTTDSDGNKKPTTNPGGSDNTTSNGKLPQTGVNTAIIISMMGIFAITAGIAFVKYKRIKIKY